MALPASDRHCSAVRTTPLHPRHDSWHGSGLRRHRRLKRHRHDTRSKGRRPVASRRRQRRYRRRRWSRQCHLPRHGPAAEFMASCLFGQHRRRGVIFLTSPNPMICFSLRKHRRDVRTKSNRTADSSESRDHHARIDPSLAAAAIADSNIKSRDRSERGDVLRDQRLYGGRFLHLR
jgi:hypothetical protein